MKFKMPKTDKRDVAFAIMNRSQVIDYMPCAWNCF